MSNPKSLDPIEPLDDKDHVDNNDNRSDSDLADYQSVRIRPAEFADMSAIISLEKICFARPWSENAIKQDLLTNSNAFYYVAETVASHLVIAFAACWHMVDEAELMRIATHPDFRRSGLANQLLKQVIENTAAHRLRTLYLEVRPSNLAARALYQRHGFQILHIRKKYYEDNGEDAIIMSKNLS